MGGRESTTRKVSFELDEEQKVTTIQGVKLSGDVLHRMRDSQGSSDGVTSPGPKPEDVKPAQDPKPAPTSSETQEELRKRFQKEHALVQEQLARLAQREREAVSVGPGAPQEAPPAVLRERAKTQEQQEKTKQLPAEVDAWAKQLERKEAELQLLSAFYKEQLLLLEKKSVDHYKQVSEQYNQAATKTEAHIQPRPTVWVCPELQSQVFQCYKENGQQTLLCSSLAQAYLQCIHTANKNLLINHG